jgi:hypothetical protein
MISRHDMTFFFTLYFCREALQNIGENSFAIEKTLPIGIYYYRFNVDGHWRHAPEFPSHFDDSGVGYNILDLQVISWFTFLLFIVFVVLPSCWCDVFCNIQCYIVLGMCLLMFKGKYVLCTNSSCVQYSSVARLVS